MDTSLHTFLRSHGIETHVALAGGYQSTVYRGVLGDAEVAVKVVDARASEITTVRRQAQLARDLAAVDPRVVAPLMIEGGDPVLMTGGHLITVLPFVGGRTPDLDDPDDAVWLGRQLALLHASMRQVPSDLPLVASLRAGAHDPIAGEEQLIHGDPGASNFLRDGNDAHVLDLGAAGLGTAAYDVALALFSRRFESWSRGADRPTLDDDTAPSALLEGYASEAGHRPSTALLTAGLEIRREALAWWLDNLDDAPIGIRTASPEWHRSLARFVDHERQT